MLTAPPSPGELLLHHCCRNQRKTTLGVKTPFKNPYSDGKGGGHETKKSTTTCYYLAESVFSGSRNLLN